MSSSKQAYGERRYCNLLKRTQLTFTAWVQSINPLTPNDHYSDRTAPLTFKRCILYIYSTNTGTEYFKHVIYSPFFFSPLQNAVCFIILTYSAPVLFTFYIQGVLKLKKKFWRQKVNPGDDHSGEGKYTAPIKKRVSVTSWPPLQWSPLVSCFVCNRPTVKQLTKHKATKFNCTNSHAHDGISDNLFFNSNISVTKDRRLSTAHKIVKVIC